MVIDTRLMGATVEPAGGGATAVMTEPTAYADRRRVAASVASPTAAEALAKFDAVAVADRTRAAVPAPPWRTEPVAVADRVRVDSAVHEGACETAPVPPP